MYTTRTRTISNMTPTSQVVTQTVAGQNPTVSIVPRDPQGSFSTVKDNNNRGYREAMAAGIIVLSDCDVQRSEMSVSNGSMSYIIPGSYTRTDVGNLTPYLQLDDPVLPYSEANSDMSMLCLIKAFAKLKRSSILSGETGRDLNETLSMLRHPFKGVTKLLHSVLTRRNTLLKASVAATKASSSAWLEYRYGWKPLLMDIDNAIDLFHSVRDKLGMRRFVARSSDAVACSGGKYTAAHYVHPQVGVQGNATSTYKRRCSAGVIYSIQERTKTEQLIAGLGLRPRDVVPTFWEITPYSFVIDWFVNVGDWLQAITPCPGIVSLGHWVTNVSESEHFRSGSTAYPDPQPDPSTVFHGDLGSVRTKLYNYNRTCNQTLSFTPVLTKGSLSILHEADALALSMRPIMTMLRSLRH